MTPQTPPTDRPLTAGDVPLLREGDVLRCAEGQGRCAALITDEYITLNIEGRLFSRVPPHFTFVSRPTTSDAEGWIEWHGGENPVPGKKVNVRMRGYSLHDTAVWEADRQDWTYDPELGDAQDIIAYRIVRPSSEGECGYEMPGVMVRLQDCLDAATAASVPVDTGDLRAALAALASPPVSERERELEGALAKAVVFNAYRAEDPLAIRIEFMTEEDRLAAANAIDKALTAKPAGEGK